MAEQKSNMLYFDYFWISLYEEKYGSLPEGFWIDTYGTEVFLWWGANDCPDGDEVEVFSFNLIFVDNETSSKEEVLASMKQALQEKIES